MPLTLERARSNSVQAPFQTLKEAHNCSWTDRIEPLQIPDHNMLD